MDPYEVLGVSKDADEETIKKAYRELVKKYHPDKYVNNPLADLAAEKIKEINKAYDMIMNKTQSSGGYSGGHSGSYSGGSGNTANAHGSASFAAVRTLIAQGRINEAAYARIAPAHSRMVLFVGARAYADGLVRPGHELFSNGGEYGAEQR